jgi:hypothetical protein
MDVELHNSLRSGYAKRLLQLFTVRAARGWRVFDPWVLDLKELYELLEVPPTQWGKSQTRTGIETALRTLAEHGVLGDATITKLGKGSYQVHLAAGERLLAAGYQRGSGSADGTADRMLLWHLRSFGFSAQQARELVRTRPDQVRTVLRRVYYLQAVKGGLSNGRPIEDWTAWIKAAIDGEFAFSDAEWQRWLASQLEAGRRGEWLPGHMGRASVLNGLSGASVPNRRVIVTAATGNQGEPEGSAAAVSTPAVERVEPVSFSDDLWGQALERFVAAAPEHGHVYRTWLARTSLDTVTENEVTVVAEDAFAAEWIAQKYRDPLVSLLSAVAGRDLALTVRAPSPGAPSSPAENSRNQADLFERDSRADG